MTELQAVRSELTTLKESVERNLILKERFTRALTENQNQQGYYQGPRGCINCQKEGRVRPLWMPETPIIGCNVIEEVVKDRETEGSSSFVEVMNTAWREVALENVTALVEMEQTARLEDFGVLKSGERNLRLPRG